MSEEAIEVIGTGGDYEAFLDTLANYLSSAPKKGVRFAHQPDTRVVYWVLGDIGLSNPPGWPVGFIAPLNDLIVPYGKGGSTGGPFGTDFDEFTVPIVVVAGPHTYEPPIATARGNKAFYEAPTYRELMALMQTVRKALRVEGTFGGAVATSTITELRPMLIDLDDKVYRGARLTLTARARRPR